MRKFVRLLGLVYLLSSVTGAAAQVQSQSALSGQLSAGRTVYFDDQSHVPKVGERALARLKKWGRFKIVQDRQQAELIILLSTDSPKGGNILLEDGRTGTVGKDGDITIDSVPIYNKAAPVRYAYLTVLEARTGAKLWTDSHQWGGLLTGFNSVGERLVNNLEKETKK